MNREDEIVWHYGGNPNQDGVYFTNEETATDSTYSDRLWQQDPEKYDKYCLKHWNNKGQLFDGRYPEEIQAFLSDYIGRDVIVCRLERLTNKSNGYPLWRMDFRYKTIQEKGWEIYLEESKGNTDPMTVWREMRTSMQEKYIKKAMKRDKAESLLRDKELNI